MTQRETPSKEIRLIESKTSLAEMFRIVPSLQESSLLEQSKDQVEQWKAIPGEQSKASIPRRAIAGVESNLR